jgi:hypothetical protein
MPYIKKERRQLFTPELEQLRVCLRGGLPGDLNYLITSLVREYLGSEPDYGRFNAAVGVLECAKLEIYRQWIAPYEDRKRRENGGIA